VEKSFRMSKSDLQADCTTRAIQISSGSSDKSALAYCRVGGPGQHPDGHTGGDEPKEQSEVSSVCEPGNPPNQ
jgi:hypothetical protein